MRLCGAECGHRQPVGRLRAARIAGPATGLGWTAPGQLPEGWWSVPSPSPFLLCGAGRACGAGAAPIALATAGVQRLARRHGALVRTHVAQHRGPAGLGATVARSGRCDGRAQAARRCQPEPWFIEAHQFRIDTTDGIGRPTPEGAHRDGVDLVAVFLIERSGIKGGETRVFDAEGPNGQRFTLAEPWSLLLLDDARVIHESTPIQPLAEGAHRDTLVLTCRSGGFQGLPV